MLVNIIISLTIDISQPPKLSQIILALHLKQDKQVSFDSFQDW